MWLTSKANTEDLSDMRRISSWIVELGINGITMETHEFALSSSVLLLIESLGDDYRSQGWTRHWTENDTARTEHRGSSSDGSGDHDGSGGSGAR